MTDIDNVIDQAQETKSDVDVNFDKLISEMQKLSGCYANPDAQGAEASEKVPTQQNAPQQN